MLTSSATSPSEKIVQERQLWGENGWSDIGRKIQKPDILMGDILCAELEGWL